MPIQGASLRVVDDGADPVSGAPSSSIPPVRAGQSSPNRVRIIDATLDCLARHGTLKTTVDDIARQAGVSRATVYRVFPGGRDEVLAAAVDTEMARLFSALGVRLGEAEDLEESLVNGIVEAATRIEGHAALRYLVDHEPAMVLGHLAFDESNRLLGTASRFTAPFLARWMSPMEAGRVAEWASRIVLSYAIAPSSHRDLTDPADTAYLVRTFLLPGINALHAADLSPAIDITPFEGARRPDSGGSASSTPAPQSISHPAIDHSKGEPS